MFATQYLEKNNYLSTFWADKITNHARLVLVIPCYNEPFIEETLRSVYACNNPQCNVAIIVVVNHQQNALKSIIAQNHKTVNQILKIKYETPGWIETHTIFAADLKPKHAGVGFARKIGMDAAIAHFNNLNMCSGVIISLDADSVVEKNYLQAIDVYFKHNTHVPGASIYFEHKIPDSRAGDAMVLYELNMRYYYHALKYAGFPHPIYTVGSAFAVKALAYVEQGGMNRRKAGEDFYFLHKLTAQSAVGVITNTTVYPSARESNRVPFGTGPAISKYLSGNDDLNQTYPLEAFLVPAQLFSQVKQLFSYKTYSSEILTDNTVFRHFIDESNFVDDLTSLRKNCSNETIFVKRFFQLFNAFKFLKWLNFAAENAYFKRNLVEQSIKLYAKIQGVEKTVNPEPAFLLSMYRSIDKSIRDTP